MLAVTLTAQYPHDARAAAFEVSSLVGSELFPHQQARGAGEWAPTAEQAAAIAAVAVAAAAAIPSGEPALWEVIEAVRSWLEENTLSARPSVAASSLQEVQEAMGGADSKLYGSFRLKCCEAFNILRANGNLILNLLMLMVDANVQHLQGEADVAKVTEKLRLDLTNEEAARYFQGLINDSVSALFPQVIEKLHEWAQYWRS